MLVTINNSQRINIVIKQQLKQTKKIREILVITEQVCGAILRV